MSVPGIGPIIASAMVAAIGDGSAFSKGSDFNAWLGLMPKQISTEIAPSSAAYQNGLRQGGAGHPQGGSLI
jgi:transposase